jgi:hypothetical protein
LLYVSTVIPVGGVGIIFMPLFVMTA